MFDNLELSTETFNGAHIERINFIFSPTNRYDTTGNTSGTSHGNLQFFGFRVPFTDSSERLAAPSQYQRRRASFSVTSFPSRETNVPANTPALYVRTMM